MLNFKQYRCSPFFRVLFIVFHVVSVSSVYAQTDSLANKSYEELRQLYIKSIKKNPSDALIYISKAYEVAVQENNENAIVRTLYGIAFSNRILTNNSEALAVLEKTISLLKKDEEKYNGLLFDCYNLKGIIFTNTNEGSKALNAHIQAKKYAKNAKNLRNEIKALTNIAFIKKVHKDYEEAIRIFKENLALLKTSNIRDDVKLVYEISQLANIADTYLRMNKTKLGDFTAEAKHYNDIALQKSAKKENAVSHSYLMINEMGIFYEQGKYDELLTLIKEIENFAIENDNEILLTTTYFYTGKSYTALKQYKEAITSLEKSNAIIQKSEKKYDIEKEVYKQLYLNYRSTGEEAKEQLYFDKYDALQNAENLENVKIVKEVYVNTDIPNLEEGIRAEKQKKKQLYYILGGFILAAFGGIVWYQKNTKKLKKRIVAVLQQVDNLEKQQLQVKNNGPSISEKITDKKAILLLEKLQKFEDEELYLLPNCSLGFVAEQLESNTSYVSNVINNYKNKTFKSYITELRINTALVRLKNDEKLRSYTIKAIAGEFGFKRQETFSKAFKLQTGIYPSQYLKKLRDKVETL